MKRLAGREHLFLLVEGNSEEAAFIQGLLEEPQGNSGNFLHVCDLGSALREIQSRPIDAVLLNLRLPDASGVVCVEKVRAVASDLAIVVLTGLDDEELALACIGAGAQEYIAKPDLRPLSLRRAIAYAMARSQEVLERRRAETLQQHLAAIVEASGDAIVSCTPEGIITSWNTGAETIFGYARSEVLGRNADEILGSPSLPDERHREIPHKAVEMLKKRKDGATVTVSMVACRLLDSSGRLLGLAATYRDLTELQQRDQQMRALAARLDEVREEERKRISRTVHDELGQLLTGLKMDLGWVGRRLRDECAPLGAVLDKLGEAEASADSILETVQRIAVELRPSTLDALGLAAALRDEAARFEKRAGIPVSVQVSGSPQPRDQVATVLFRIFQELLTNAARHSRATRLKVSLEQTEEMCCLRVEDNGVGFDFNQEIRPNALGFVGIRERAHLFGGSVRLQKLVSGGTLATVEIPQTLSQKSIA